MRQIWEWEPLTWLSPAARGLFLAVAVGMAAVSLAVFVTSESSTAPLIFLVLPIYVGIAYAAIFVLDRTMPFVARR